MRRKVSGSQYMKILRLLGVSCAVLTASFSLSRNGFAAGQHPIGGPLIQQRICGVVQSLQGGMTNPSGVTVQLGLVTTQIKILPQTTVIVAKSAEAEVEGLLPGDYVLVNAVRRYHLITARRLTYDVQPFFPLKAYSGTVLRQTPDQKRFLVRLVTNHTMWFRTSPRLTRYEVDGKLQDFVVPLLTK